MASTPATLLILATILLFFGHVARAARWALLFPPHYLSTRFDLLLGLSIGYAANAIFPWRLGEILRAFFVSRRESVHFSFVAATVLAERLTDLFVIGSSMLALAVFFDAANGKLLPIGMFMILMAVAGIVFAVLVGRVLWFRRLLWSVASVFNDKIRIGIIEFCWSFSEIVAGRRVVGRSYLIATVVMWCIYAGSYFMFGLAVGETLDETFYALLGSPSLPLMTRVTNAGLMSALPFLLYSILPVVAVIGYGFTRQWSAIIRDISIFWRYGGSVDAHPHLSTRDRFKEDSEYEYFLASLFNGDDKVLSGFGLLAMADGVVQRLFNGGSEAITALVEVDQNLVIRKFAVGSAAEKLKAQGDWLKSYRDSGLPVVELIGERQGSGFYRYDMPLVIPANDFYDVIHTSSIERSKALLETVFESITAFHRRNQASGATKQVVEAYLTEKALKNALVIMNFAKDILQKSDYRINGKNYRFSDWDRLADLQWLSAQVHDYRTAIIHGDLTIENIIVAPERKAGLYLIDPNPDNLFDSPLIDLAKLMQSLHLGYEGLNRGKFCAMSGDGISLTLTRSRAYSELQDYFEGLIARQYGANTVREVYFHELVNYLRLTPYKIRKDPAKGITFFACTSILLERYLERPA